MNNEILVSILSITYNQVKYVKEMLDGFLNQETDFGFEILIHDDASTDGTIDILREYEAKNSCVHIFTEKSNRFSEGINYINEFLLPNAKGKYIAICEGDDYWCARDKLQKQVDYMESHPSCSLCTHSAYVISGNDGLLLGTMGAGSADRSLNALDLAKEWHFPTASFLFKRSDALSYAEKWSFKTPVGDFPRAFYLATVGDVFFLAEEMSVYRFGTPGSWTSLNKEDERRLIHGGLSWLTMLDNINKVTDRQFENELIENGKSKVIRLRGHGNTEFKKSYIGNLAFSGLSIMQRIKYLILNLCWTLGFDFQRQAWSGNRQWRIVRRNSK